VIAKTNTGLDVTIETIPLAHYDVLLSNVRNGQEVHDEKEQ
jgi:hypothetical protein